MIEVIFRSRLRPEHAAEYAALAPRMEAVVRGLPGFRSLKGFSAADGERVTIAEFDSLEALQRWRDHPEHREAQRLGRERLYAEYRVQVCELRRESVFPGEPRTDLGR